MLTYRQIIIIIIYSITVSLGVICLIFAFSENSINCQSPIYNCMIEFNISHLNEYRISECIDEICTNFIRSCSVFCNYNCVPSTEKIIPCFRSNFQCDTPACMWYYIEPVYLIIISIIIFGGV